MTEQLAAHIYETAIRAGRAAELFTLMLNGGSATVDHHCQLVMIDAETVELFTTL